MDTNRKQSTPPSNQSPVPSIALPKGGGAIRGIGEKFAANPVTGTGSMTVPIAVSPGRSGFGPQLALSYDSGAGNGPFGFGWNLSLPAITRKTDKGLPKYNDAEESDVFILSGAEDLVPVYRQDPDGSWVALHPGYQRDPDAFWVRDQQGRLVFHEDERDGYRVRRYRPRIEGLFARIERWSKIGSPSDVHWRSISKDNILTLYGFDAESRIADPMDASRIFTWLICETRDDKGNAVLYCYKTEDGQGVDLGKAHERNRGPQNDVRRKANRYLKRIHYGNRTPLLDNAGRRPRFLNKAQIDSQLANADWMFEVVFDYGEHDAATPKPNDARAWDYRQDPFSSYRSCFEVRATRVCQRVLTFHHFPGEASVERDCLVRSTDFTYSDEVNPIDVRNPVYTFLRKVTQTGYRRKNGGYDSRSLPPIEFEYTEPIVQDVVEEVDPESLENLPIGLDGSAYRWTDLHGEGIAGILTEQAGTWFYKRNLSPLASTAEFAPLETVALKPNVPLSGGAEFMDLAGDGQPDVVVMEGPTPGLYEHDDAEGWQPFRPFTSRLNRDLRDPNLKFVDLDGDGHADVLITEDDAFVWHASLAETGFGPARRVAQALDEEKGPRIVFADGTQSIYLADLSGDGLTDIVRIRNGEVCYWPNLGYGRFGAKVTMDNAPHFDNPDQFDHKRIRLADIDGTGTTDIIYLHRDGVRLYFNQSGNSWSKPQQLKVFPRIDEVVSIVPIDLLGNGTACLVWSSPLPGDARRPMRYVNLMGKDKPHLLFKTINNLGAETRVDYAPSTKFYLLDKRDGKPWITRLPFPVHVVERVETYDHVSRNRFVTRYEYHHGYFDGEEREFRGFGMVEQFDTEEFAALSASDAFPVGSNVDAASHVPPVHSKTWFHTGVYLGRDRVSNFFAGLLDDRDVGEYYPQFRSGDAAADAAAKALLLDDTVLSPGWTLDEEREACRALKGSMLRQEVYALDGTDKAAHPYTVTEQNFTIKRLQPKAGNRHGVFFTHACEAINYHYERDPDDPRIGHSLVLDVDPFGNVKKSVAIGYGRRLGQSPLTGNDKKKQEQLLITYTEGDYTENDITNPADWVDAHHTPLPAETRTYELTGFTPENNAARFSFDEWTRNGFALPTSAAEIPYEQTANNTAKQKRLIEHVRTLYRKNDLTALSPLRAVESLALPGESYKLALTPSLIASVFKRKRSGQPDEDLLPNPPAPLLEGKGADQGGYVAIDGNWWIPAGRVFYSDNPSHTAALELATAQAHFFLPRRYRDPFGNEAIVDYDGYDLLITKTTDPLLNAVTSQNDYRVLQPTLVTDPNRNRTAAAFDALGMVVATAVMGKEVEPDRIAKGDLLEDFDADPPLIDLQAFIANPRGQAASTPLGKTTTRIVYDLDRFKRCGQPPFAATLTRETHFHDPGGPQTKIQVSFSYSDGFGREIQKKIQAEAGDAPQRQAPVPLPTGDIRPGDLARDAQGELVQANTPRRWVGTGRTVFNNKGKPVRQYEPFFSSTHLYEEERDMTDTGISPILFYDPVERIVATLHPNHIYEKVVFDPWRQETWDVNDTLHPEQHYNPLSPSVLPDYTFNPVNDPDVGQYFKRLPENEYLPTWYDVRMDPAKAIQKWPDNDPMTGDPIPENAAIRAAEKKAAEKAAKHAATPLITHLDTLGRTFLTIADNGLAADGTPQKYETRIELDIEGNQRAVIDAKDRMVMRYDYDMLGNRVHQASMEAGERWMLNNVAGKPIRAWGSRGFLRRMTYDALRRPTGLYVTENGAERLAERTVYGEGQGDAKNHLTRVHQVFDGAGIVTSVDYDFKGNLREGRRDLLPTYKQAVDWLQNPAANDGSFTSHTTYDALNRPLTATSPDGSVYHPTFNEANLLDKVDVNLRGAAAATPFVTNINYNAKGQRELIEYGCGAGPDRQGATTTYKYDEKTFRLINLKTTRPAGLNGLASQLFIDPKVAQDLRHTYDPAGNITRIEAAALKTIIYNGENVEPVCDYIYDAIYRLIEAKGREHIGQTAHDVNPPDGNRRDYPFLGLRAHPNDAQAMRNYTERYEYDAVGNFDIMRHITTGGGWTRRYDYAEASLIEPGKMSNRLTKTTVGNGFNFLETYTYTDALGNDVHGCMTAINSMKMAWDFEDQLQQVGLGGGGTAYYVYDASGQRVRKVIETQNAKRQKERVYLGGFEIYREYENDGDTVKLERGTLHIMDDKQRIALMETKTKDVNVPANTLPETLIRYQFGNHLGSASLELDNQAQIISCEEYTPYGSSSYQAVRNQTETAKRYRYTGKERDEESGLYYHGARYYIPWLSRWTRPDPVGPVTGTDLYIYARNNPVRFIDPTGWQEVVYDEVTGECRIEYATCGQEPSGAEPAQVDSVPGFQTQGTAQVPTSSVLDTEPNASTEADPYSFARPLIAQQGIEFAGVGVARGSYAVSASRMSSQIEQAVQSGAMTTSEGAAQAVASRRALEAATRESMPRWASETSASRNVRVYGDPLGPANVETARTAGRPPGAPPRTEMEVIRSSGRTSPRFNVGGAILGVLGAVATFLQAFRWAKDTEERGYIEVGPGINVVTDPSRIPDGTRVQDIRTGITGTYRGGNLILDPI
jgi:RHS repeat-associated protein